MTDKLLSQLKSTTDDLIRVLDSFSDQDFNQVPFAGSWTAAQVAVHVLRSGESICKSIYGPAIQTDRDPAEKVEWTRALFLNFDKKMKSPSFIVPEEEVYNKNSLITSLKTTSEKLINGVTTLNLNQTCLEIEEPSLSGLTRLELLWFAVFHTQRHIHQLKNISKILSIKLVS